MKLYYAPGACSLADHIALSEAGTAYELEKVNLKTGKTETGGDYREINPKGYVPALQFDSGDLLTENIAILAWIAGQVAGDTPARDMSTYRLLEALAFISTEIHKSFKPFFTPGAEEAQKTAAGETITKRLTYLAQRMDGDYLLGDFGVADAYLFVMLMWAQKNGVTIPAPLPAFFERMKARPAVQRALTEEGLA